MWVTSGAYAATCPPLEGTYDCKAGNARLGPVKNFEEVTEITATVTPDTQSQFQFPDMDYAIIPDGKTRKFQEHDMHLGDLHIALTASCAGNRLTRKMVVWEINLVDSTVLKMTGPTLEITQTITQLGRAYRRNSVCTKRP